MNPLRIAAIASLALGLTACGGGGGYNNNNGGLFGGGNNSCYPGTQVQLARPAQGQSNVGSINSIEIVANGNNNTLYQSYQSWQLQVQDQFGNQLSGSALSLVSDTSGPHPYASDYYYSSSFQSLQPGDSYNVFLVQSGGCQALNIGGFST